MTTTEIRELVKLVTIDRIESIENADAVETAVVGGWKVVVKKGEFQTGDEAVYFELDSALPVDDERFAFLAPRGVKMIDGKNYHVLKTARLRGVYSQGLLLPYEQFRETFHAVMTVEFTENGMSVRSSTPAELLGVRKWEPPIPAELSGTAAGGFPSKYAMKTDSERIQNVNPYQFAKLVEHDREFGWTATEKIDGSSVTFIIDEDGDCRVASRNWEMAYSPSLSQWRLADELGIWDEMQDTIGYGSAFQGEIFGEGIQSNPLGIKGQQVRIFNAWDNGKRVSFDVVPERLRVPVVTLSFPQSVEEALAQVDGLKSQISPQRLAEGLVWASNVGQSFDFLAGRANFKAINNRALIKNGG